MWVKTIVWAFAGGKGRLKLYVHFGAAESEAVLDMRPDFQL